MNTKEKYVGMFWGAVLILIGAWFLVTRTTSFTITNPWLGMALTGGLSLVFFASYFLSGEEKWGWLFPACIFAGVTLTVLLTQIFPAPQGGWIGAPVLLGIAAPFLVAYFQDREKNRWALFPTYGLVAITLIAALSDFIQGEFLGSLFLLLIALPFLAIYLRDHTRRWALIVAGVLAVISLIPAYAMVAMTLIAVFADRLKGDLAGTLFMLLVAVTLIAAFADRIQGELVGTLVLLLIALPFLAVYLRDRSRRWALIVAGVLAVISVIPALSAGLNGEIVGPVVLFLFAAAFFVVFFTGMQRWWSLLTAGIFTTLGVVALLTQSTIAETLGGEARAGQLSGAVFFLGLALSFLVLWLRRASVRTAWAIYPAVVLAAMALVTFIVGQPGYDVAWPIILIAGGALLLYLSYRRRLV